MTRSLRLGNDPLGRRAATANDPGGRTLDNILADPGEAPSAPSEITPVVTAGREPDALARTLEFFNDIINGLDTALPCRPRITVDAESELADLPMRQSYLLGHALRLILGMGEGGPRAGSAAPLRIQLHSRLSGRLELSVTDDGGFFPASLRLFEAPHPDIQELADFVSRRGGSVLVTRGRATQISVVVWSPQATASPLCAAQ
jgi:hypothetical protein